jgi:hypothetical protein
VLGVLAIRRRASGGPYGPDARRVVAGMLGFFIVLDALVGLGGRYDMILGALVMILALRRLRRRDLRLAAGPAAVRTSI